MIELILPSNPTPGTTIRIKPTTEEVVLVDGRKVNCREVDVIAKPVFSDDGEECIGIRWEELKTN